jgi:hypothetical protein
MRPNIFGTIFNQVKRLPALRCRRSEAICHKFRCNVHPRLRTYQHHCTMYVAWSCTWNSNKGISSLNTDRHTDRNTEIISRSSYWPHNLSQSPNWILVKRRLNANERHKGWCIEASWGGGGWRGGVKGLRANTVKRCIKSFDTCTDLTTLTTVLMPATIIVTETRIWQQSLR